ncbi:ComEC/Rec2 family competence protein [Pontiellaceae bacterium B12219]|nr:ComEC/Rec2 family competence protein [Pontiellaceae bacterium B12219]
MVGIALAVSAGMLFASLQLIPPTLLFFMAAFCLLLAFALNHFVCSSYLVYSTVALTAACRFWIALPDIAVDSINRMPLTDHQRVNLIGRVNGFPRFYAHVSRDTGLLICPLNLKSIGTSNDWKRVRGAVDLKIHAASPDLVLKPGDTLQLTGTLERNRFPGRNMFSVNLRERDLQITPPKITWSPIVWGRAWRDSVAPRLGKGLDGLPVQETVLKALVLGYRKEMPPEITDVFRRTGSLHIFAISGLHVGIVGILLIVVLKTLGIPRDKFGVFLIPLLGFYVVSTGMKSSAVRALLMAAVFILAPLLRRKPDIPTSVSFAAILILFFQPLEILSAGFIFSFTVVAFLVMAFSVVPEQWVKGPWIRSYSVSLVITSVAAGLASIPLAALFFGIFSPIAFVGNLIVVPLTFCIVLCGWLSILLPIASEIFNHAAVVFIDLLLGSVQGLDRIPGSCWAVEPPPLLAVLLWYVCLTALLVGCTQARQRWMAAGGLGCAMLLALLG